MYPLCGRFSKMSLFFFTLHASICILVLFGVELHPLQIKAVTFLLGLPEIYILIWEEFTSLPIKYFRCMYPSSHLFGSLKIFS